MCIMDIKTLEPEMIKTSVIKCAISNHSHIAFTISQMRCTRKHIDSTSFCNNKILLLRYQKYLFNNWFTSQLDYQEVEVEITVVFSTRGFQNKSSPPLTIYLLDIPRTNGRMFCTEPNEFSSTAPCHFAFSCNRVWPGLHCFLMCFHFSFRCYSPGVRGLCDEAIAVSIQNN